MIDHYGLAESIIAEVGNITDRDDRMQCAAEAQVHATLATVQQDRQRAAADELSRERYRTIPWPPSPAKRLEVATLIASMLTDEPLDYCEEITDDVFKAIGGEA